MLDPLKSLLQDAEVEIQGLRRRAEILQAKVDTMDLMACMLFTAPHQPVQGMSPDVAWQLRKKIDEIEATETKRPRAVAVGEE